MLNLFKKIKNNNKGSTTITRGITYMGIFVLITFALDIIFLGAQMTVAGYALSHYSSKMAIQGGLIGAPTIIAYTGKVKPGNWTNQKIINGMNNYLKTVGIQEEDWILDFSDRAGAGRGYAVRIWDKGPTGYTFNYANDAKSDPNDSSAPIGFYGRIGEAWLEFDYKWRFSGALIPGTQVSKISHKTQFVFETFP